MLASPLPRHDIPFLDFFAGFGGSSSGLVERGFKLTTAFNHWDKAIAVHSANHREADHVQGDLSGYDMRRLPKGVPFLWASPECTWHSPAGGRRRVRAADLDLFDDYVPTDAGERSRATMFDPIRAAEARGFKAIAIENVVEVASWPLFTSWLKMWEALDYSWQIVNVSAAHVYDEHNAPSGQWRDRIYIVLSAKGVKMPRIEPRPPAWCPQCAAVVESRQHWKRAAKDGAPQVGKYRKQYVYVCGANAHAQQIVEPYALPASAVIDWSDLGTRIGDRARPLAAATMRRLEVGARMFARPMIVKHSGQTWDAAKPDHPSFGDPTAYHRVWAADADPLMTRQAGGSGDALAVPPYIFAVNHDGDVRAQELDAGPLPTRSTKIGDGLVFPPFITHQYGVTKHDQYRSQPMERPLGTVVAGGSHHAVVVPPYITEMYGTGTGRGFDEPLSAVTAGGNHHGAVFPPDAFLSRQYSQRSDAEHLNTSVHQPMHAVTASGGNHALVIPGQGRPEQMFEGELPFAIEDMKMRMLGPKEHLRAQRFWEDYDTSAVNKSETTKGAGNAVAVNVANWIGSHVAEALA